MDSEIKYYLDKRKEGAEYSEIRADLIKNGYFPIEVTQIINEIDDEFIESIESNQALNPLKITSDILFIILGLVLLSCCAILVYPVIILGRIGVLQIFMISFCFSAGSYFFYEGRKNLIKAKDFKNNKKKLRRCFRLITWSFNF